MRHDLPMTPGRLIVLSGPGGVGKSTVVRKLRESGSPLWLSVSVTTRKPRPGEIAGIHYDFVTPDEFAKRVELGEFLEWANFAGALYGTPAAPALAQLAVGKTVLLEIDLEGARQVRSRYPDALLVFLAPPSWEELERRLVARGTDTPERMAHRLEVAKTELGANTEFDHTLINTSVEEVVQALVSLGT